MSIEKWEENYDNNLPYLNLQNVREFPFDILWNIVIMYYVKTRHCLHFSPYLFYHRCCCFSNKKKVKKRRVKSRKWHSGLDQELDTVPLYFSVEEDVPTFDTGHPTIISLRGITNHSFLWWWLKEFIFFNGRTLLLPQLIIRFS